MLYILLGIGIFIIIIFILRLISKKRIKDYDQKLNICFDEIESVLDSKSSLIQITIKAINNKKLIQSFKTNIEENIFEKDDFLYDFVGNIKKSLEKKKKKDLKVNDYMKEIDLLDEDLEGLKNYYNSNASKYNYMLDSKVFKIFYVICKLNKKEVFKLRKLEEYE